jgi:hypothetical protein
MTLYRSLVIGLLGACLFLLAHRSPTVITKAPMPTRFVRAPLVVPQRAAPTLIDVSSQMSPDQLVSLVRLTPGERITSYDDHRAYVDVIVQGLRGERRVLMLVH